MFTMIERSYYVFNTFVLSMVLTGELGSPLWVKTKSRE
jgi:hypothetical protein